MIRSTDPAQIKPMRAWMCLDLEASERKFLMAHKHMLVTAIFPQGAAESAISQEGRAQSKTERWRTHPGASHFLAFRCSWTL